jgi:hypothetical protein
MKISRRAMIGLRSILSEGCGVRAEAGIVRCERAGRRMSRRWSQGRSTAGLVVVRGPCAACGVRVPVGVHGCRMSVVRLSRYAR